MTTLFTLTLPLPAGIKDSTHTFAGPDNSDQNYIAVSVQQLFTQHCYGMKQSIFQVLYFQFQQHSGVIHKY